MIKFKVSIGIDCFTGGAVPDKLWWSDDEHDGEWSE